MYLAWFLAGAALAAVVWVGWYSLTRRPRGARIDDVAATDRSNAIAEMAQLAGGLAHEIKNPLSTINVNLRLLSEDLQRIDDDDHRRWLKRLLSVQAEADRLKATLDDFLRLTGKIELSPQPTDLRTVVDELVDFFGPQAESDGALLRSNLPAEPVICNLDSKLFKQALLNLLINAVQAMTEGGELILRVAAADGDGCVEVIDTGPGLTPEDIDQIFSLYYSTKAGGSGLGLPTTRRIIQEHGGRIQVDSEIGRGTRFAIFLPLSG